MPAIELDDLPDAVVIVGGDGLVRAANGRARRLLRLPPDAVGRPAEEVCAFVDENGNEFLRCTALLTLPAPASGLPERPWWLPDGREVLVTARVRRCADGRVDQAVVSLRTAAGRDRYGANRADLVATVAHELRSPLTGVKGFTGTLLTRWERFTDAQKRLMVEAVAADADRLGRLITDLLDVARIESGRLEVRRVPLDLGATVQRQVETLVARGEPADRFVVTVDDAVGEVHADADQVDQVLGNLLDNAVRHGAGRVGVEVRPAGAEEVALVVHDEGGGVPDDIADRVFARFWRAGTRAGSGLGLYIVRGVVEAHGGSVTLRRGPWGGAAFEVRLPAGLPDVLRRHPAGRP